MGTKLQIDCPKCSKRMRIPVKYVGAVRCPKCKFQFDKISKSDSESNADGTVDKISKSVSESIDDKTPNKTTTCTHCGGNNEVESGLTDYYRCKHCDYDVLTLEQSEIIKQQQEKRSQHWMNRYSIEISFLIPVILGSGWLLGFLLLNW